MTARIMSEDEKGTPEQKKQFMRLLEDGVDKLFKFKTKEEIQRVVTRGGELQDLMMKVFEELSTADSRFEEIGSFSVVVPEGYNHGTAIADLHNEHRKEFYGWNDDSNDANFAKATTVLTPGRRFKVKMLAIKSGQMVSSDDCLKVIAAHKGVLAGAQGAVLAYKQGKTHMSRKGKWFVSFDKKDNLPKLGGYHGVPDVNAGTGGDFYWYLGSFVSGWGDGNVLLCFCDENE